MPRIALRVNSLRLGVLQCEKKNPRLQCRRTACSIIDLNKSIAVVIHPFQAHFRRGGVGFKTLAMGERR